MSKREACGAFDALVHAIIGRDNGSIVARTAVEGWRVGASCPIPEWRDGWAGYAEIGAVAWAAIDDLDRRINASTWNAMEGALRNGALMVQSAHPALELPARLWRALAEAGPCPEPTAAPELTDRWWLVEIEDPADDEPNAIALWEADGCEVALTAFLGVEDGHSPPCLTVVTWCTGADGARTRAGVAVLGAPVRVDDPDNPES